MTKTRDASQSAKLRQRAERKLQKQSPEGAAGKDAAWMLHELQVHQIELELQNEELRRARDDAEQALARYAELYDFAPVGYFTLDGEGAIHKTNLAGGALLGTERAGLANRRFAQFVADKDKTAFRAFLKEVFSGGGKVSCEVRLADNGDCPRVLRLEAQADEKGLSCRAAAVDITDRKLAEERRVAQVILQRDLLVREVHHRIKNHLQGCVGLIRSRVGSNPAAKDTLEIAMNQLNAIATAHGLQSANTDESLLLCDTAAAICSTLQERSGRTVDWRIDYAGNGFRPVALAKDEAVSIALVINELVWNAIKHSPAGTGAAVPSVRLVADGNAACLRVRNRLPGDAPGGGFDFVTGRGLHTGLQLVRALLPPQGARLAFIHPSLQEIEAELWLDTPVIAQAPAGA